MLQWFSLVEVSIGSRCTVIIPVSMGFRDGNSCPAVAYSWAAVVLFSRGQCWQQVHCNGSHQYGVRGANSCAAVLHFSRGQCCQWMYCNSLLQYGFSCSNSCAAAVLSSRGQCYHYTVMVPFIMRLDANSCAVVILFSRGQCCQQAHCNGSFQYGLRGANSCAAVVLFSRDSVM